MMWSFEINMEYAVGPTETHETFEVYLLTLCERAIIVEMYQ